jgi:hypothetical protein
MIDYVTEARNLPILVAIGGTMAPGIYVKCNLRVPLNFFFISRFSNERTTRTGRRRKMHKGPNDADLRKDEPFGVSSSWRLS